MKKEKDKSKSIGAKLKGFIHNKIYLKSNGLLTLVMMQLKDKIGFSFNADKKGTTTKLILRGVLFIVITALIFALFKILPMLSVFGSDNFVPISIFNFVFFIMLLLSIVSCIARLTNSLYFAKDNVVLLSYPVKPNIVFLSKLMVFFVVELIKTVTYMMPLFIAYGIAYAFPWYYFLYLLILIPILALIPVAVASVLSIPYMFIKMFFTKRPYIQDSVFLVFLIALTVLIFYLISLIPEKLHLLTKWNDLYLPAILKFCRNIETILVPLYFISSMAIGCVPGDNSPLFINHFNSYAFMSFGIVIASIVVLITISYLLAKPLFFKISAKPFEYNKRIIFHDFRTTKSKIRIQFYEDCFVPSELDLSKLLPIQLANLRREFEKALNEIYREQKSKLFRNNQISSRRICNVLKKYTGKKWMVVNSDEFVDNYKIGFVIEYRQGIPFLVLAKSVGINYIDCYDPNYLAKKNHPKSAFISSLYKDVINDFRTPGIMLSNYILFIITPLAIAFLNKIFAAIDTSFMGNNLTMMFNILIMTMIFLASNVSMASIYSKEGENAYLLKSSPANYIKTLTTKLLLRFILMSLSIILTVIIYQIYSDITYIDPWLLTFAMLFIYSGHLLWCAELDYMNPQDKLYSSAGEAGNISNPNETTAAILTFVIAAFTAFVAYFFIEEQPIRMYLNLFLIAAIFLACRILLFILKIRGYGTVRGERGKD